MADGCIHHIKVGSPTIILSIQAGDIEQVQNFAKFLKTDKPVKAVECKQYEGSYNSGPQVRFRVSSNELANDLAKFGVVPKKSLIAEVRQNLNLSVDFWRGYIDGNGSIFLHKGNNYPYLIVSSASERLLEQFSQFCKNNAPGCKANVKFSTKTQGEVRIGGSYALKLLKIIYHEPPHLDRKNRKAMSLLRYASIHPNWCLGGTPPKSHETVHAS